jgi:hypothetical protein
MCIEQREEVASKQMKINPKSKTLQRLVTFSRVISEGKQSIYYKKLHEDYDLQSMIAILMHPFNDIGVAAKMLRRLLPMTEEQSVELINEFTSKNRK